MAPGRLQAAIAAGLARRRDGAEALLDAIAAGKASARLLQEQPVAVRARAGEPAEAGGAAQGAAGRTAPGRSEARRAAGPAPGRVPGVVPAASARGGGRGLREELRHLPPARRQGARRSGRSSTASAAAGLDRLIEDILDPNRNVDQAFRVTSLALENGQVVSGLLLREEGEILVLADAQGKEVRVPRASVVERKTSPLSPMPANFADQISEDDFNRLLDYLLSKREPANRPPGTK